jgi:hypothetical protein
LASLPPPSHRREFAKQRRGEGDDERIHGGAVHPDVTPGYDNLAARWLSPSAGLSALDVVADTQVGLKEVRHQPFRENVERLVVNARIPGNADADIDDSLYEFVVLVLVRVEVGVFERLHERLFDVKMRPCVLEQVAKDVVKGFGMRSVVELAAVDQLVADTDQFLMMAVNLINADRERIAPAKLVHVNPVPLAVLRWPQVRPFVGESDRWQLHEDAPILLLQIVTEHSTANAQVQMKSASTQHGPAVRNYGHFSQMAVSW